MKISSLTLENFKRFTNISIQNIPKTAKLILIIGSNGSGKSCVFDAFDFLQKQNVPQDYLQNYYTKIPNEPPHIHIELHEGTVIPRKMIGRSSIRNVAQMQNVQTNDAKIIENNADQPRFFIENDTRFVNDAFYYIQSINKALREPVFRGEQADVLKIFKDFIEPFNQSLKNIFGDNPAKTIRIVEVEEAGIQTPPKLIFEKGNSKINYDLLSHGEKQVVILLINFIVRQKYYENAVIFIDEMDLHLNTKLQYNALKEITERWIPDTAQLWTASHALGFIDYANDCAQGAIIDFDDLDFDHHQIIYPSQKDDLELFELAVSKEFINKVFAGKIIFAEQTDANIYNQLKLRNDVLFFDGKDKLGAFIKAQALNEKTLIDRDYLTDDEIINIQKMYPFVYFTPYYNIESVMYHPDNLAEYYKKTNAFFDKKAYIQAIFEIKQHNIVYIAKGIEAARKGYPFFKENKHAQILKQFQGNTQIFEMLQSDDFEVFYKVFNAKEYGKTIAQRQNISRQQLANTQWFRVQIAQCLQLTTHD